jgi:hypothetical protein
MYLINVRKLTSNGYKLVYLESKNEFTHGHCIELPRWAISQRNRIGMGKWIEAICRPEGPAQPGFWTAGLARLLALGQSRNIIMINAKLLLTRTHQPQLGLPTAE